MAEQKPHNAIRTWALIAVFLTSGAMIFFSNKLINLLAEPTWCNRAVGAVESTNGRAESAVSGCFALLDRQVQALALNSHFAVGTQALSLLVLVVILLAGGRLSFTANKGGVSANLGSDDKEDPVIEAAKETANAADEKAEEIVERRTKQVDDPDG